MFDSPKACSGFGDDWHSDVRRRGGKMDCSDAHETKLYDMDWEEANHLNRPARIENVCVEVRGGGRRIWVMFLGSMLDSQSSM